MSKVLSLPPDLTIGDQVSVLSDNSFWHLPTSVFEKIWSKTTGRGVTIAVLDTGYTPHPDLPEPVKQKSFIRGEAVRDGNGHGCHVAGTALGRNGMGFAPEADLIVGKVLSDSGSGSSQSIAEGVRWAVNEGADVINLSIGGGGFYRPMQEAIAFALEQGCKVFAAAGNSGYRRGQNSIDYPGKYFESICVGSYDKNLNISSFSSGGREIDIACPGSDILSASHRGSGYQIMGGTSMATPGAAGLFALTLQLQREEGHAEFRGVDQLREFYSEFTQDAGDPGKDERFGYGIPMASEIAKSLAADDVTMASAPQTGTPDGDAALPGNDSSNGD